MATAAEILSAIDTCIIEILENGQSVRKDNGLMYTRADLDVLRVMRKEYAAIVGSTSVTDPFSRANVGIPYRG